jgi:hypothetical protein
LVKFGGGITDMRGSIGGTVFSRNKSGAIARQRTTPINPRTALQSAARAILSFISQLWRSGPSAAQKEGWDTFAKNVEASNKLGETIRNTAANQFTKSNTVFRNAGIPEILDAPVIFTLPGADPTFAIVASEATQELAITFDDTREWVDEDGAALIVQMGLPQDDSINFFGGPYRKTDPILGAVVPPVSGDPVAVSFPISAGQKIFARAKIIRADGRVSGWFPVSAIAGA